MVSWKLRYLKGISILQGLSDSKSKGLGKKIKNNTKKCVLQGIYNWHNDYGNGALAWQHLSLTPHPPPPLQATTFSLGI